MLPDKVSGSKDDRPPDQKKLKAKLREILKRKKRDFKTFDEEIHYKMESIVNAIKLAPEAEAILMNDYNKKLDKFSGD